MNIFSSLRRQFLSLPRTARAMMVAFPVNGILLVLFFSGMGWLAENRVPDYVTIPTAFLVGMPLCLTWLGLCILLMVYSFQTLVNWIDAQKQ